MSNTVHKCSCGFEGEIKCDCGGTIQTKGRGISSPQTNRCDKCGRTFSGWGLHLLHKKTGGD